MGVFSNMIAIRGMVESIPTVSDEHMKWQKQGCLDATCNESISRDLIYVFH